jgi:hypothetical protein
MAAHQPLQAQPRPFRQVFFREIHELPHALPFRQVLQHVAAGIGVICCGSDGFVILGAATAVCQTLRATKSEIIKSMREIGIINLPGQQN